jgi:AcrR family transcriptional regulator
MQGRQTAVDRAGEASDITPPRGLRDSHNALTRELILKSAVGLLEQGGTTDLTIPEVAKASGVSVRTIYRHFPTRDDLLMGASEWIGSNLFRLAETGLPDTLEGVVGVMAINVPTWDERPELVRVMALTQVGNAVRSVRRRQRLENLQTALGEVTGHLSEAERRQAEGVFGCLSNMLAWVTMHDENGMSGQDIATALQWAMRTLIADLQSRNEAARDGQPLPTKRGST